MEVLGVAASIVGLVSLAVQLIDKLQSITAGIPVDQTREFSKYLSSSLTQMGIVEDLVKKTTLSTQSSVLMQSLAVQLEDYTDELKEWQERAQRSLTAPSGKRLENWFLRFRGLKSRQQRTIIEWMAYYEDRIEKSLTMIWR
jgi:hypothetical protein